MKSAEDVATFSAETIPFHKKGAAVGSGVIGDRGVLALVPGGSGGMIVTCVGRE